MGELRGLYYHYCYLLGYLPKRNLKPYQVSPELRDELIKLNEISKEVRLLQEHRIDDLQQLFDYRKTLNEKVFSLRAEIQKLRTVKVRKSTPAEQKINLQSEIERLKTELNDNKYQVIICNRIVSRSQKIREKFPTIKREKDVESVDKKYER